MSEASVTAYNADGVVRRTPAGWRIPDQNLWTGELLHDPLTFVWDERAKAIRLSYEDPADDDWEHGLLWLRHGQDRSGYHQWKAINTPRTRRMMAHNLCMVCSGSAVHHGRIRWLLHEPPILTPDGTPATNVPPTCLGCTPEALVTCPRLREQPRIVSAASTRTYGVRVDIYAPDEGDPVPARRVLKDADIPLLPENRNPLLFALGKQPLVALLDMREESFAVP